MNLCSEGPGPGGPPTQMLCSDTAGPSPTWTPSRLATCLPSPARQPSTVCISPGLPRRPSLGLCVLIICFPARVVSSRQEGLSLPPLSPASAPCLALTVGSTNVLQEEGPNSPSGLVFLLLFSVSSSSSAAAFVGTVNLRTWNQSPEKSSGEVL